MNTIFVSEELISLYGRYYFSGDSFETYKKYEQQQKSEEGFLVHVEEHTIYLYHKHKGEVCVPIYKEAGK